MSTSLVQVTSEIDRRNKGLANDGFSDPCVGRPSRPARSRRYSIDQRFPYKGAVNPASGIGAIVSSIPTPDDGQAISSSSRAGSLPARVPITAAQEAPPLPSGIAGWQFLTLAWGRSGFFVPGRCRGDLHLRLRGGRHGVQPCWLRL